MLLGEPLDAARQAEARERPAPRGGMTRKANEISPRWRNALTRKRGRPGSW